MFDLIKTRAIESVPFAKMIGVEILDVRRGIATARLVPKAQLNNHLGTMHAAALFALAEAASGAAMASALAPVIQMVRPVASQATILYERAAKTTVLAEAWIESNPDTLVAKLHQWGQLRFSVEVSLTDEARNGIAAVTVEWHVRLLG